MNRVNCILLIDDDRVVNTINRTILNKKKIANEIVAVENGQEAIDFLLEKGRYEANGHTPPKPNVILLDLNMPIMDGWEFLEEFKSIKNESCLHDCRIYVLTSSPNPDDMHKAKSFKEVTGYFVKPLSSELMETLSA